jgi:hypothetical protein
MAIALQPRFPIPDRSKQPVRSTKDAEVRSLSRRPNRIRGVALRTGVGGDAPEVFARSTPSLTGSSSTGSRRTGMSPAISTRASGSTGATGAGLKPWRARARSALHPIKLVMQQSRRSSSLHDPRRNCASLRARARASSPGAVRSD